MIGPSVTTAFALGDVYEIIHDGQDVQTIVRYRGGENTQGEVVSYDGLPMEVQIAIFKKLKQVLKLNKAVSDAIEDLKRYKKLNEPEPKASPQRVPETH